MSAVDLRSPMVAAACKEAAKEFGTPSYIYFVDHLVDRVSSIREAYSDSATISYAVKANPNREILRRMRTLVDHLDISSGGELTRRARGGLEPRCADLRRPGKSRMGDSSRCRGGLRLPNCGERSRARRDLRDCELARSNVERVA